MNQMIGYDVERKVAERKMNTWTFGVRPYVKLYKVCKIDMAGDRCECFVSECEFKPDA